MERSSEGWGSSSSLLKSVTEADTFFAAVSRSEMSERDHCEKDKWQ
jgi:hypothetical protein